MLKYLFIAEKPSVMNAVKDTYHRHKADIANKIGEIEFTALSGHVCRYLDPDEYSNRPANDPGSVPDHKHQSAYSEEACV